MRAISSFAFVCAMALVIVSAAADVVVTDRAGKVAGATRLIDSEMIGVEVTAPAKIDSYRYRLLLQDAEPTPEQWAKTESCPFHRDLFFFREPQTQWIRIEAEGVDGHAISECRGLKGSVLSGAPDAPLTPQEFHDAMGLGFDTSWPLKPDNYSPGAGMEVAFKRAGFTHFRHRINAFQPREPDLVEPIWDLDHLETIINESLRHGMMATVSVSASAGFHTPANDDDLRKFLACWEELSERFKNCSHRLAFELFVETGKRFDGTSHIRRWEEAIIPVIRAKNPTRIVIHSAAHHMPSSLDAYHFKDEWREYGMMQSHRFAGGLRRIDGGLKRLVDDGRYDGIYSTWTIGTPAERANIEAEFKRFVAWREREDVPIYWGAIMTWPTNHWDNFTAAETARIAEMYVEMMKKYKFPMAYNAADHYFDMETKAFKVELMAIIEASNGQATYNEDDPDGDGLSNAREKKLGTDPSNCDTDDDGMTDGEEVAFKFNPLDPKDGADGLDAFGWPRGPGADADGDGMPNRLEILYDRVSLNSSPEHRFDPYNPSDADADYDDDGLTNREEVALMYCPVSDRRVSDYSDTKALDADGLSALDEIRKYKTDPVHPDTDRDGVDDGDEVKAGTDPLKPNK